MYNYYMVNKLNTNIIQINFNTSLSRVKFLCIHVHCKCIVLYTSNSAGCKMHLSAINRSILYRMFTQVTADHEAEQ